MKKLNITDLTSISGGRNEKGTGYYKYKKNWVCKVIGRSYKCADIKGSRNTNR